MEGADTEWLPIEIEKDKISRRLVIKLEKKYWDALEEAMKTLKYNNKLARPYFFGDLLKYIIDRGILSRFVEDQLKELLEAWREKQQK